MELFKQLKQVSQQAAEANGLMLYLPVERIYGTYVPASFVISAPIAGAGEGVDADEVMSLLAAGRGNNESVDVDGSEGKRIERIVRLRTTPRCNIPRVAWSTFCRFRQPHGRVADHRLQYRWRRESGERVLGGSCGRLRCRDDDLPLELRMIFFETEADPTEWFLMPLHWTGLDQDKIEDWSETCAEIMFRKHKKWWNSPNKKALTARFRQLLEAHPHPAIPADQVFLYGGDPRRIPQPFYALAAQTSGEDHHSGLLKLVQADEENPCPPVGYRHLPLRSSGRRRALPAVFR